MLSQGALGLDHAGRPSDYRAFVREALSSGFKFEFRYLCDPGARSINQSKILRPEEAKIAQDEGLEVCLVWQNTKLDASGGYSTGLQHGQWAAYQAAMSGFAPGTIIYFAFADYDVPSSDYSMINDYLLGVRDGVGSFQVGGYGKRAVVEEMLKRGLIVSIWQSYGFSRPIGEISPLATVYQRKQQVTIHGVVCDVNEWLKSQEEKVPNTICPFAAQYILHGEEDKRPIIKPIATALHIAVTTASGSSLGRYFDSETVKNDSTFYVDLIGGLWQFGPVNRQANAQFGGNKICVSIETGGMSGALNAAQVATLKKLYAWLKTEWSISLEISTRWDGPGAGWHSKYPEWNKNNHQCPGQPRVDQLKNDILPGAKMLVAGTPVQEEDEEMPFKQSVAVPWMPFRPGEDAHFIVFEQEYDPAAGHRIAVASVNHAPFDPAWSPGDHGGYEDFEFLGFWWRKFKTPGKPSGVLAYPDRVDFTAEGTAGTYTLAVKK